MVNAADAVLSTQGFRLRGKTGSHEARFGFPSLPRAFREQAHLIRWHEEPQHRDVRRARMCVRQLRGLMPFASPVS